MNYTKVILKQPLVLFRIFSISNSYKQKHSCQTVAFPYIYQFTEEVWNLSWNSKPYLCHQIPRSRGWEIQWMGHGGRSHGLGEGTRWSKLGKGQTVHNNHFMTMSRVINNMSLVGIAMFWPCHNSYNNSWSIKLPITSPTDLVYQWLSMTMLLSHPQHGFKRHQNHGTQGFPLNDINP